MARYRVEALVTGIFVDEFDADNEEQAKEMMQEKHGGRNITLCYSCSQEVDGITVSEEIDTYDVEKID